MTNVICVCGAEAPIVLITEDEPDDDIREVFFGKSIVRCENCHTITQVTGNLQELLDVAEEVGMKAGEQTPLVSLVDANAKRAKSPVILHGRNGKEP
jgi:hypothetical protein